MTDTQPRPYHVYILFVSLVLLALGWGFSR
jgi:hypothetical protein